MAAKPRPGKLYIDPTSAAVGGTLLAGILDDRIEFDDGRTVRHFGAGPEIDNWATLAAPAASPAKLIIPVRDVSAATMQLLLALLSTGTAIHSSGGQGTATHGMPPSVALALRPKDGSEILYGPRWTLHAESVKRLVWSRTAMRYEGSQLVLAPHRSLDHTKRAFMEDSAANIDAHYGLGA
jgi:hypothetical protein